MDQTMAMFIHIKVKDTNGKQTAGFHAIYCYPEFFKRIGPDLKAEDFDIRRVTLTEEEFESILFGMLPLWKDIF